MGRNAIIPYNSDKDKEIAEKLKTQVLIYPENIVFTSLADIIFHMILKNPNGVLIKYEDGNTEVQTLKRNRSAEDLFVLTSYYIPDITFKHIRTSLETIRDKSVIMGWYCSDIERFVYTGIPSNRHKEIIINILNDKGLNIKIN